VQPLYEAALKQATEGLADAVSIQDDFTIVGTVEEAMKVFDYIAQHSSELGLELRVDKCEVYTPPEAWQNATTAQSQQLKSACGERKLKITKSMESLGVMHGSNAAMEEFCAAAAEGLSVLLRCARTP
jgi:hypothetical protein